MLNLPLRWIGRLLGCRRGGTATVVGLGAPVLFGIAGVAIDYATFSRQSTLLQAAADAAAIAATRELQIGAPTSSRVQSVAEAVVASRYELGKGDGPVKTIAQAIYVPPPDTPPESVPKDMAPNSVRVILTQRKDAVMSRLVTPELTDIAATATAQLAGATRLCVIGLEESAAQTIALKNQAILSAPGCSVYSNSTDPSSISANGNAKITALMTCSAGGYKGQGKHFAPHLPTTDCPKLEDPLSKRPAPAVGGCTKTDLVLLAGFHTLNPGTYCGGIRLEPGANVMLRAGIYVIKDGPLTVGPPLLDADLGLIELTVLPATLKGTNVGFYFTGTVPPDKKGNVQPPLLFMKDSVVELTAPKTGPLAGILFFEDRAATPGRVFDINSDAARKLVGTIYLPRGTFSVTARKPVADQSEYTAIVVRKLELDKSPNLYLNTRYADTDVPVPDGLGPNSGSGRLIR